LSFYNIISYDYNYLLPIIKTWRNFRATAMSSVTTLAIPLSCSDSRLVVHTHAPHTQHKLVSGNRVEMLCGWENSEKPRGKSVDFNGRKGQSFASAKLYKTMYSDIYNKRKI